jgi:methionyl-tRNA formyltransferase
VASFPALLRPAQLESARHGAVGLHFSLLPRHRGPDPLFWTYFHGDEQAGVTLHWLDAGEDTGDIVYQEAVALARGRPVTELYAELAERGARLLERGLAEIARGIAPRVRQDDSRATREPVPEPRACVVDCRTWSAERVHHVLSGVGRFYPLLLDASARPLRVEHARLSPAGPHGRPPGTIERCAEGLRVFCRQGSLTVTILLPGPRLLRPLLSARP